MIEILNIRFLDGVNKKFNEVSTKYHYYLPQALAFRKIIPASRAPLQIRSETKNPRPSSTHTAWPLLKRQKAYLILWSCCKDLIVHRHVSHHFRFYSGDKSSIYLPEQYFHLHQCQTTMVSQIRRTETSLHNFDLLTFCRYNLDLLSQM